MRIEDLSGQQLGRYQVTGTLGRGGMAAVYRALDTALRRDVALKVLYQHYLHDEDQIARFKREAIVAAGLDHPNIVQVYDVGEEQGLIYIAMQLLAGQPLADLLRDRGTLDPHELAPIIDQIASALDYAHARGIIHRDIKPANILIDPEGRAVLTDFGIAKLLDTPGLTSTSVIVGTPDYMAPEQIGSQPVDGRVDIYALGVLIFRALTGQRPYQGGTDEVLLGHLQGTVPSAVALVPHLPPAIDTVIRTAMARQPANRYGSAGELAAALREAAGLPQIKPRRRNPVAAMVPPIAPTPLATDVPTVRGNLQSTPNSGFETTARQPSMQAAAPPQAEYAAPSRRSFPVWAIVAALVLALVGGGGYLLAQRANGGGIGTLPTATATEAPSPQPTQAPTEAPVVLPSTTPIDVPTEAPTAVATSAPTITSTTAPRSTETPTATPTQQPTATPTATPTVTTLPTATATQTPIPVVGGFAQIYVDNERVRSLGSALEPEQRIQGGEQPFERGSMFRTGEDDETVYVLLDSGAWLAFPEDEQTGNGPTPTPPATPLPDTAIPDNTFGTVWKTHPEVRALLGLGVSLEYNTAAAYQRFERGTMLYSETGAGSGAKIYVLLDEDNTLLTFDNPRS